eukprot:6191633-Pleurochrysis_carterae.AAC.1
MVRMKPSICHACAPTRGETLRSCTCVALDCGPSGQSVSVETPRVAPRSPASAQATPSAGAAARPHAAAPTGLAAALAGSAPGRWPERLLPAALPALL